MGDKEREIVHFSVGFGIFQNDDEVTDGWSAPGADVMFQTLCAKTLCAESDKKCAGHRSIRISEQL